MDEEFKQLGSKFNNIKVRGRYFSFSFFSFFLSQILIIYIENISVFFDPNERIFSLECELPKEEWETENTECHTCFKIHKKLANW